MARLVRLKNTRLWLITGTAYGTFVPTAPTVSSLTPGTGIALIHANMAKDYDIGADETDSINEEGIDDVAKVKVPTSGNYHGMMTQFRDFDPTTFLPTATDCLTVIPENTLCWIVRRKGLPSATAVAASQKVECYKFRTDVWQLPDEDGMIKAKMRLFEQGEYYTSVTVAA